MALLPLPNPDALQDDEGWTSTTFYRFLSSADSEIRNLNKTLTDINSSIIAINNSITTLNNRFSTVTGTTPVYYARAWVNFNGVPASGTYTQSGTTITVTLTAHGMTSGMIANMTFTGSASASSGSYAVTVTNANTFTITVAASATIASTACTRNTFIRSNGNVASVVRNGAGDYTVNFTTALPDANYSISYSVGSNTLTANSLDPTSNRTTSSYRFKTINGTFVNIDDQYINCVVFR